MNILYLASQSKSRQQLLQAAYIPFQVINQSFDEKSCDWNQELNLLVQKIAQCKMRSVVLPDNNKEGDIIYILTADSLTQDKNGKIYGKPNSYQEAFDMLNALQGISSVSTAFCLEKRLYTKRQWIVISQKSEIITGSCELYMPESYYQDYFATVDVFKLAGAFSIEGYCQQFVESVSGSYSAIIGLPMFQVRQALERLGFFEKH